MMLVLSRKRGEALVIGNGISVTVLEMRGSQVKLGVVAPTEVRIQRNEALPQGRFLTHGADAMLTVADAPTIAEVAMGRLRDSPYKVMRRVSCECKQGVLFLRGRLFSVYEKQVALATVTGVNGVTEVVNEIEITN